MLLKLPTFQAVGRVVGLTQASKSAGITHIIGYEHHMRILLDTLMKIYSPSIAT